MKKLNFIDPDIKVRKCENGQQMGRGVYALKDIPRNTEIAIVHEQRFIKYKLMHFYEFQKLGQKIENENEIRDKTILFALYLSYIYLDPKSQHANFKKQKAYLKELPEQFDNLICWSREELEYLGDQQLVRKITGQVQRTRNSFDQIKKKLLQFIREEHNRHENRLFKTEQDLLNISFKLLLNMYAAIKSRNMHHITFQDSKSQVGALVPFIELFNHSSLHNNVEAEYQGQRYVAKTRFDIKAGQQLFVKYADHTPEQFLQWYGFIPDVPSQISQKCADKDHRKHLAKVYKALKSLQEKKEVKDKE